MQLDTTNILLVILGIVLILCFILMIMNNDNNIEAFDPVIDAIQQKLQNESPGQLKSTIKNLQQRLIDYGYSPDLTNYVTKTELSPNSGKCLVSTAEDRDKYVSKSDIPSPGPRIDLSQYVKKSSIPPQTVCPPPPEIDYSAYVKKSTLPPNEKCPPCIAPKVKVSAGLCRECPPAPVCPPPERCPELKCPAPEPCPTKEACTPCDEVRYIKVPTVITKTVMVDSNGNVLSQQINSGNTNPNNPSNPSNPKYTNYATVPTQALTPYKNQASVQTQGNSTFQTQGNSTFQTQGNSTFQTQGQTVMSTQGNTIFQTQGQTPFQTLMNTQANVQNQNNLNSVFNSGTQIPTTTFPTMSMNIENTTLAQTLDENISGSGSGKLCPSADLNSEFKKYGIYGRA
jgi:hypothetical protein